MNNVPNTKANDLPSNASLIKATVVAAIVAVVILVTTIWPAEYGMDPTGLGKAMGLTNLHQEAPAPAPVVADPSLSSNLLAGAVSPVWRAQAAPRTQSMTITLLAGQGAEIKSPMNVGDNFVFNWQVEGGSVYFDMHGEPPSAGANEFTSYWIGRDQSEASGQFTANFKGTHGWYWQNTGATPVKITLTTTGFYGDLYMP